MARHRRGKRGFGKKNHAIPVAPLLPLVGVIANDFKSGANAANMNTFTEDITGYNMTTGKFNIMQATPFWGAEIAGIVVHKVAAKVGVNRYVKKLTMGYLEL
jgi:hypothetical protein